MCGQSKAVLRHHEVDIEIGHYGGRMEIDHIQYLDPGHVFYGLVHIPSLTREKLIQLLSSFKSHELATFIADILDNATEA